MGEFFAMGSYGTYVWFAYGVTLVSLVLLFLWSWFGARSRETELEQVRQWARAERTTPSSATLSAASSSAQDDKNEAGAETGAPAVNASGGGV